MALLVIAFIFIFGYMAYMDEKDIDEDLRKADDLKNLLM